MRKLIFRFTVALLGFGLGVLIVQLLSSSFRLFHAHRDVTPSAHLNLSGPASESSFYFADRRAADIADTVKRLREIQTEQFDNKIPPAARQLLTRLKTQLLWLIEYNLRVGRQAPAKDRRELILTQLKVAGVTVRPWEDVAYSANIFQKPYAYGDIYDIDIAEPAGHPELLAVTTTLGLCCGEDTSLYVFKRDGEAWRLVLAQEANDYEEVSGGQGMFQYAISPTDAAGAFFVVTANVTPWCSSNWQTLRYSILRAGQDPYLPRTLLSNKETIFLDDDPPYKLEVKEIGFTLEFDGECSRAEIMNGEVARKHVIGGTVLGDSCSIELR
jgi:hypothetical protein